MYIIIASYTYNLTDDPYEMCQISHLAIAIYGRFPWGKDLVHIATTSSFRLDKTVWSGAHSCVSTQPLIDIIYNGLKLHVQLWTTM